MRIYFAGSDTEQRAIRSLKKAEVHNRLVSYHYLQEKGDLYLNDFPKVFLDSGGFSAFTKGVELNIESYAEFIKKNQPHVAANLDVIGSAEGTKANQLKLEKLGVAPLPVVHFGCDTKDLKYYCEKYDYFALGGLVPYAKNRKRLTAFLDWAFSEIKKHWPKKVHGFGMTANWVLARYPWYSVDSTSWLRMCRYGNSIYMKKEVLEFNKRRRDRDFNLATEIGGLLKEEKFYTELWTRRGVTWDE